MKVDQVGLSHIPGGGQGSQTLTLFKGRKSRIDTLLKAPNQEMAPYLRETRFLIIDGCVEVRSTRTATQAINVLLKSLCYTL